MRKGLAALVAVAAIVMTATAIAQSPEWPEGRKGFPWFEKHRVGHSIHINPKVQWTDTRTDVRAGDLVVIRVEGTVQTGADRPATNANGIVGRLALAPAPLTTADHGALIARVGEDGEPFVVGIHHNPFLMVKAGRIFLGVNDGTPADNKGAFFVTVGVGRLGK